MTKQRSWWMYLLYVLLGLLIASVVVALYYWFRPPEVSVLGLPQGFVEKQFDTGEVILNYVEGPANGTPLLLIPGQMEGWQGYKLVLPALVDRFHIFVVEVRGNGKSTYTPGNYSFNIMGQDLKMFLEEVIAQPAIVSGLSSGGVLSVWLGAYAPEFVLAVIAEDPPMYSAIAPRVYDERMMNYIFNNAINATDQPDGPDLYAYLSGLGRPVGEGEELQYIPDFFVKGMVWLYDTNRKLRPARAADPPLYPFSMRAGLYFMQHYDVDFSRATLDGRLGSGFDPDDALSKIKAPMLLMQADGTRHPYWGLIGAMDDNDVARVKALVPGMHFAKVTGSHDIHMAQPERWLEEFLAFIDATFPEGASAQ